MAYKEPDFYFTQEDLQSKKYEEYDSRYDTFFYGKFEGEIARYNKPAHAYMRSLETKIRALEIAYETYTDKGFKDHMEDWMKCEDDSKNSVMRKAYERKK